MNPRTPAPTPADDQPVSDVARRLGPPIAIGSLVLAAAMLAWLALAPTAIAGPLTEAPFSVPATLVTPPEDDGCLRLVTGDGSGREVCVDELAADEDDDMRRTDAWFDEQGRLVGVVADEEGRRLLHLDPATGEVLATLEQTTFDDPAPGPRPGAQEAPAEPSADEPPPARPVEELVYTDGDRVLRSDDGRWEPSSDEVLLDLAAPPGYRLEQAVLSPDERWVVVVTGRGEVVVAPADGDAAPYAWAEVPADRWLDLRRAIRWDG